MNKPLIVGFGVAIAVLIAVGITVIVMLSNQAQTQKQMDDRYKAQQALAGMKSAKQKRQAVQMAAAERAERARQEAEAKAAAAAAEAAKPHYDPIRLQNAAKLRQWANTTIPDYNINCWLKTNWKDGKMNFRLAMLGQKEALSAFQGSWPEILFTLTDQGGTNLHTVIIRTTDLRWAPIGTNQGVPTMEFESNDEIALELYERAAQWNFNWQL